jgi:hypothetical protein
VMNRNGLLHFDAHFNNVMADDDRIYITDFGLATSTRFELSAAERAFVSTHGSYDRAMSSLMLAMTAARLDGHTEPIEHVRRVAEGGGPSDGVLARHAAAAVVLHDFFEALQASKRSAYPEEAIEAALAAR